jgi:hypothetical protein
MNYSKPEITSLASASFVIQGTNKTATPTDNKGTIYETVSAYEADE